LDVPPEDFFNHLRWPFVERNSSGSARRIVPWAVRLVDIVGRLGREDELTVGEKHRR
jgi:hypothetical protein